METVIVRTQADLDALPVSFAQYTAIEIRSDANVWITVNKTRGSSHVVARESSHVVARESSHVEARGSSHVEAWESSHVEAWESSHVEAWGSSHVVAWGYSHVEAWESSHVVARGSSHVVARESSHVEAWESSHVVARESSHVEARESSHVVARGSSHVVARESSHVEAWGSSHVVARGSVTVSLHSAAATVVLFWIAVCIRLSEGNVIKESQRATVVDRVPIVTTDDWMQMNGVPADDYSPTRTTLFKRVSSDFKTQENTPNETQWAVGSTLMHPAWSPDQQECGPGKFHACAAPYLAASFRDKADDRYVAISIEIADLYAWPGDPEYPEKIAFRAGTVLYECDRYGGKIA